MNEFLAAVALFDVGILNRNLEVAIDGQFAGTYSISWSYIAARDGAIRILDFEQALQGAHGALNRCGVERLKPAGKSPSMLMDEFFPKRAKVRNAAAHTAEAVRSEQSIEKHIFSGEFEGFGMKIGEGASVHIQDMLYGRTYIGTWAGEIVSYELSLDSLAKLEEVKQAFLSMLPAGLKVDKFD